MSTFREFLFKRGYRSNSADEESKRAMETIRLLYHYFIDHEEKLPGEYALWGEPLEQRVVDYTAGMPDQYTLRIAEKLNLVEHLENKSKEQRTTSKK